MLWSAWLIGLMAGLVALALAVSVRPPPREAWIRRVPLRSAWRVFYLVGAGVVVLMIFISVVTLITANKASDLRALPGYLVFAAGFGYVMFHAFKHGAVIISDRSLFVYPVTIPWSDAAGVVDGAFMVRIRRKGRWIFADVPIARMMYRLTREDVALIESRARAV